MMPRTIKQTVCATTLLAFGACHPVGDKQEQAVHGPAGTAPAPAADDRAPGASPTFTSLRAPAGDQPTARHIAIDGRDAAILPNGRLVTPVGQEVNVDAPKPFGLAVTLDGKTAATINSGSSRFSVTLINNITVTSANAKRIPVNATFMGIAFSPDGARYYASGGENGNVWVGDAATGAIIGSINLTGPAHPLPKSTPNPFPDPARGRIAQFKGSFPGALAVSGSGKYLYVVDQGDFTVKILDTTKIVTGVEADGKLSEMDNFAAVVGKVRVGRYPFGVTVSPDDKRVYVANVGMFQYSHLIPRTDGQPGGTGAPTTTGDNNADYPLCFPGTGYPDDVLAPKTIQVKKIDASKISTLPASQRDPDGIRCGYVPGDRSYTIPALGDPNVDESSSVFVLDVGANPTSPPILARIKTGVKIGEVQDGIAAVGGSHPNAVAVGEKAAYVSNGNNDTVTVLDAKTGKIKSTIALSPLTGDAAKLRGIQPVSVALSPDQKWLYVAEAGINAVAVVRLDGFTGKVVGHIPTGWWPSSVQLSGDGQRLFVASAKGRGAPPNQAGEGGGVENGHPKHSVFGTVQILDVADVQNKATLQEWTNLVLRNNGFVPAPAAARPDDHPIPSKPGVASSRIKHVVFITKENLTHDLMLGDVLETRRGQMVDSDPRLAIGADAAPNHHELALSFAFSDNFYLEPTVSSDGHRWLVNNPTTEFEETHWPASYGGKRIDSGDNAEIIDNWFGRIGFTDANAGQEPHDYPQHGSIWDHLSRNKIEFANFGEGFEFAVLDEDPKTEPTGAREHVNTPMLKVLRDRTDHMFPTFNTAIPDAPLPENPDRFSRFGRFAQVFKNEYVKDGECKLPPFTNLYYPNDHGGGANDINGPAGPPWDFKRFVQDNDSALGLTVELISKSPCWRDTVIFVTEDDTQSGLDHVDGYRTIFLAIGPWVKREYVSKTHASLASVFKTIDEIFGVPPLNLVDAPATDLADLFTTVPNYTPYKAAAPIVPRAANPTWARLTAGVEFDEPDADEISLRGAILKSERIPRKNPVVYYPPQLARAKGAATR
jgi:DNA-binding beta-propeller fold protein YncE